MGERWFSDLTIKKVTKVLIKALTKEIEKVCRENPGITVMDGLKRVALNESAPVKGFFTFRDLLLAIVWQSVQYELRYKELEARDFEIVDSVTSEFLTRNSNSIITKEFFKRTVLLSMNSLSPTTGFIDPPASEYVFNEESVSLYGTSSVLAGWVVFEDYQDGELMTAEVKDFLEGEYDDIPVLESYVLITNRHGDPIEISVYDFTLQLTDGNELSVHKGTEREYAPHLGLEYRPQIGELNGQDMPNNELDRIILEKNEWAVFEISFLMLMCSEVSDINAAMKLIDKMTVSR